MDRSQQIQQLTGASARLTGVIDRLRSQESGSASEGTRTSHSSEGATGTQSEQQTDRQILAQISQEVREVSDNLS